MNKIMARGGDHILYPLSDILHPLARYICLFMMQCFPPNYNYSSNRLALIENAPVILQQSFVNYDLYHYEQLKMNGLSTK